MATDVSSFVRRCHVCQDKYRPATQVPPLRRPVPDRFWQVVSMDFAGPLGPLSNKVNKYVMVYVDNFPRYTYLVSCNSHRAAAAL